MYESFPGYYHTSAASIDLSAPSTLFVFDANVLLNLYRFPKDAAEDLIRIIDLLSEKVWLPHQAALEYQRNRLGVIAEQNRRFREVRHVVEKALKGLEKELDGLQLKKRHSTINPDSVLAEFRASATRFDEELRQKEAQHQDVTDDDPIRQKLSQIFQSKVGNPPPDQDWLTRIDEEGKKRYSAKIPPGYRDQGKEGESFYHAGIEFRREFGDLILWKQIIWHCSDRGVKQLVFVTDDDKEDWWYTIE